jgi:lipoprotein-releasing system permease protein
MIKTENPYGNLEVLVQDLQEYLGSGYGVYSWKELLATQYASFKATQQLLLFIMTLIMIVASFHVTAATTMLVIDKNREIAILKASGASPKDIEGIFIRSALITVMMGALVGIAIGLGIGYTINEILQGVEIVINTVRGFFHGEPLHLLNPSYYLVEIPVIIRWPMVLGIYGAAVLIGTLAGWGPARRAGAISPVAILQKQ